MLYEVITEVHLGMAISGSPKKLAQDVRDGFFALTAPMLRQYTPPDIKTIIARITSYNVCYTKLLRRLT